MNFQAEDFFTAYGETFGRNDADELAQYFAAPCLIASEDNVHSSADAKALHQFLEELLSYHREHNTNYIKPLTILPTEVAPWLYQVAITWAIMGQNDRERARFQALYSVRLFGEQWKIIFVVTHEEREAFLEASHEDFAAMQG